MIKTNTGWEKTLVGHKVQTLVIRQTVLLEFGIELLVILAGH